MWLSGYEKYKDLVGAKKHKNAKAALVILYADFGWTLKDSFKLKDGSTYYKTDILDLVKLEAGKLPIN
jgi:hypothetical protein